MSADTHLAGVHASLQGPCTDHAVVQHRAVHSGGSASGVGDEEDVSVQQLAAVALCKRWS